MRKFVVVALFAASTVLPGCRLYNLERRLGPEDAEFMARVNYIMTREERKIFLELPDTEKAAFKEEFWKRRDPDPATEENEFKTQYFERMDEADKLFPSEGRPGWLTDRGRMLVLFGPPTERLTYPMDAVECREVWYYGAFPVIFIDEHCNGQFRMVPINLEHLQELNRAQDEAQRPTMPDPNLFDYEAGLTRLRATEEAFEGRVVLVIPYDRIWFVARDERLEATLEVRLEVRDLKGNVLWRGQDRFDLALSEDELKSRRDQEYRMEVPLLLTGRERPPAGQKARLDIFLKMNTEGRELRKSLEVRLD
jgi:GWxTD domain-containing protein